MTARVLVVEDDENLRVALRDNLEDEGHEVEAVATVAAALAARGPFDLVVLDVMLPDGDGYALCARLRAGGDRTPVLMLTARSLEDDVVRGLDAGADDYLVKPFRLRELLARVRALLRRGVAPAAPGALRLGDFRIDPEARRVTDAAGREVVLTRTELDVLLFFVRHANVALERDRILDAVWGAEVMVDPRTVDNFVLALKKKLCWTEAAPFRFRAVRGVGYRLELDRPVSPPARR
jgi:DNA-binding response OmpR family regulator